MNLPRASVHRCKQLAEGMSKTPYKGAKDIQKHLAKLRYGAEENIRQERWARYPHEVKRYVNCNDAGILSYCLALELGLECILAREEDYDGSGQAHLSTLVRGSRKDYAVHRWGVETFKPKGKVTLHDIDDVVAQIEGQNAAGIKCFLATGQELSTKYVLAGEVCAQRHRRLSLDKGQLVDTAIWHLPGMYLHNEKQGERGRLFVSGSGYPKNRRWKIGTATTLSTGEGTRRYKLSKTRHQKLLRATAKTLCTMKMAEILHKTRRLPEWYKKHLDKLSRAEARYDIQSRMWQLNQKDWPKLRKAMKVNTPPSLHGAIFYLNNLLVKQYRRSDKREEKLVEKVEELLGKTKSAASRRAPG